MMIRKEKYLFICKYQGSFYFLLFACTIFGGLSLTNSSFKNKYFLTNGRRFETKVINEFLDITNGQI